MTRPCDVCGTPYEAKRRTSRYCSTKCRTAASRAGGVAPVGDVVALHASQDERGPVEAATWSTLAEVDKVGHPLGAAALTLARRLDSPGTDTGSAIAAVARQLEATLATVTRGQAATAAQSLQDELAARRAKHA